MRYTAHARARYVERFHVPERDKKAFPKPPLQVNAIGGMISCCLRLPIKRVARFGAGQGALAIRCVMWRHFMLTAGSAAAKGAKVERFHVLCSQYANVNAIKSTAGLTGVNAKGGEISCYTEGEKCPAG